jgi:putative SOS response-associated peptidase YedK
LQHYASAGLLVIRYNPKAKQRRGLIPADGFYEWRTIGGTKIHFTLGIKDDRPFAFAGVWDGCKDPAAAEWLRKIITGQSTGMRANAFSRFSKRA